MSARVNFVCGIMWTVIYGQLTPSLVLLFLLFGKDWKLGFCLTLDFIGFWGFDLSVLHVSEINTVYL